MIEGLPHLALPPLQRVAPRHRQPGGGRPHPRENPGEHARHLSEQLEAVAGELVATREAPPLGIRPRLVFRIELDPRVGLTDDLLRAMGLHVLAIDGSNRTVVFPDDASLQRLRDQISRYGETDGRRYANSAALEMIRPLGPDDRVGRRLARRPLGADERAALDIELWHSGNRNEMLDVVDQLRAILGERVRITDQYVGRSVCLLRAFVGTEDLATLLRIDHVKEIDRRPVPVFDLQDLVTLTVPEVNPGPVPDEDAHGIVVVDSGVLAGHPLLRGAVGDSRVFVHREEADITSGHGTWVAGLAAYGDVAACLNSRTFEQTVWIYSAKVTIRGDEYDPERLVESQLRQLVDELTASHPKARVFNISLGDSTCPYVEGSLQFRLAAVVDELAYEFRDRGVLFVVSSGNHLQGDEEDVLVEYPEYLFDDGSRVIDPATSCIALTVGGLSYGEGRPLPLTLEMTDRGIADRGWPSPFTRTGFGHGGSIKPDLVDFAGDVRFDRGRPVAPGASGVPTTSHLFAPPEGELFRTVAGTSFAAPQVAHTAAQLLNAYPSASSNLVRALLADSARIPSDRPAALSGLAPAHERLLRVYGYGKPDLRRAAVSDRNRVLLLADDEMDLDHVRLYEILPLPDEFRTARGRGRISVTLAFDPPTRHTRTKDYLGTRMQFALFRNVDADAVYDYVREWSAQERDDLETDEVVGRDEVARCRVDLEPGPRLRNRSTLQRGVRTVAGRQWRYDGEPLLLAVVCQRRWAPAATGAQSYAVVVSVAHDSPEVDLYAAIQLRARAYERVRVRA